MIFQGDSGAQRSSLTTLEKTSWKDSEELEENEVIPKRAPSDVGDDMSNKVSMSSTAQGSNLSERTEVLAGKVASFSLVSERSRQAGL